MAVETGDKVTLIGGGAAIDLDKIDPNGTTALRLIRVDAAGTALEGLAPPAGSLVGTTATQTLTNKTLTSPVLDTGVSGTAVLDEDDLASDSATKLATQQSIKSYIDNSAVYGGRLVWTSSTTAIYVAPNGDGTTSAFPNVVFAGAVGTTTKVDLSVVVSGTLGGSSDYIDCSFINRTTASSVSVRLDTGESSDTASNLSLSVSPGDKIQIGLVASALLGTVNIGWGARLKP